MEDAPELGLPPDRPPHFFTLKRLMLSGTFLALWTGINAVINDFDVYRYVWLTWPLWLAVFFIVAALIDPLAKYAVGSRLETLAEDQVERSGQDAVAFCREQADARPDLRRPDRHPHFASVLTNLGARFSELGRPADALPVTEEAVAMYRKLAFVRPDLYRTGLASSLENLGSCFSELGRPADALPVTEEAVAMYRKLAAANLDRYRRGRWRPKLDFPRSPERYRGDLASALTNLGARFCDLGRPADALPVTEEAVAIYRELATASPDHYDPDLASSLTRLTTIHEMLSQAVQADSLRNPPPIRNDTGRQDDPYRDSRVQLETWLQVRRASILGAACLSIAVFVTIDIAAAIAMLVFYLVR